MLLPNEKFSGKTQGVKGRETGWGRKQGGKEKKRELPLNCGSAESDHIYEASASSRTLRLTPRQGCTIQLPRLCTAQLQRIHSQRQQRWFCRGSRLAPTQMVWESGGLASAHLTFSVLDFSCPNRGLQYSHFLSPSISRKTHSLLTVVIKREKADNSSHRKAQTVDSGIKRKKELLPGGEIGGGNI